MADSIMKTLLTNPSNKEELRSKLQSYNSPESEELGCLKLSNHLKVTNGKRVDKFTTADLDHCYCKPSNWRPENIFMKPVENLFIPEPPSLFESEEEVDVVGDEEGWKPFYDVEKARVLMDECKKHISLVRADDGDSLWDLKFDKSKLTTLRTRLFDGVVRILHNDRLARLSISHHPNEPILRRIQVNKTARRFRTLLAVVHWEPETIKWLHNTLLDVLEKNYLVAYVDILQTLKSKIPTLIERMIQTTSSKTNADALNVLVQRPWDPAALIYPAFNFRKLPGNPIILLVPATPGVKPKPSRWCPYLSQLGTLVTVVTNNAMNQSKVSLVSSLEHMLTATRVKLADLRKENQSRPIYLVGIGSGAALAAQVALLDFVNALVLLGLPLRTVEGARGQADDSLCALSNPTLFVIGQHASTASVDEVESLRERLTATETALVVVGAADDLLRVPKAVQIADGVTQHVIDRCIIEEVGDFLGQAGGRSKEELLKPRLKMIEQRKRKGDEWNSNQSSSISVSLPNTTPRRGVGERKPATLAANADETTTTLAGTKPKMHIISTKRGRKPRGSSTTRGSAAGRPGRWKDVPLSSKLTPPPPTRRKYNISESSLSNGDPGAANLACPPNSILLSEINSVVGTEGLVSELDESENLVDQLTPDRLLEMPIIIASDPPSDSEQPPNQPPPPPPTSQVVVRQGNTRGRSIKIMRGKPSVRCARIILRKKGANQPARLVSSVDIEERPFKKIVGSDQTKSRLFHIPATKHSQQF